MADTVTTNSQRMGNVLAVTLTGISDGTGETNVVKVDKSALTLAGVEPTYLHVLELNGFMEGHGYVTLAWDNATDSTIAVLGQGNAYHNWEDQGGLKNPGSNSPGDIILSTNTPAAGAVYMVYLRLKLA